MKIKILVLLILAFLSFCMVWKFQDSKNKYINKRQSCVEYSNGGGAMIISYEILKFSRDSVLFYTQNAEGKIDYQKTFKFEIKGNYIFIKRSKEDFMALDIEKLKVVANTLFGSGGVVFIKE